MKDDTKRLVQYCFIALMLIFGMTGNCLSEGVSSDTIAKTTDDSQQVNAEQSRAKAQESVNALSLEIQDLKKSVVSLNKNLRVLEEDLLFPADTQLTVFLAMDVGKFFKLDSVRLKIDGKDVTSHIYTDKELFALSKGGTHRLHVTNLSIGNHTLTAFFTGTGPNGREYKRGTSLKFEKSSGAKYVELTVTDSTMKLQPEFAIAQW